MAFFDLPLDELKTYAPPRDEPDDFDQFWAETLDQARQHPLNPIFEPVDFGLRAFETFDVTFNGYGGQPIKGWFIRPANSPTALPCVVEYIGYGGGRTFPYNWLTFPAAGFATLVMDTRGQGSAWSNGDTPDLPDGANASFPGFMTQGVLSPHTYYYRRVMTDAVRAVEAAKSHPTVDSAHIAVSGGSQGGGLALAVAGLTDVQIAMPDVPFLCHFRRATTLVDSMPYGEIVRYLSVHRDHIEQVYRTLSYFDGVNLATRAKAHALFSVALMDTICPPSTVFAAYNYYAGEKDICVYEFNGHEGGLLFQTHEKIKLLHELWG